MSYEIKIQCSLHEEMWKIRALLLIASLFLNEIMAKGEGKSGICQGVNLLIPSFYTQDPVALGPLHWMPLQMSS